MIQEVEGGLLLLHPRRVRRRPARVGGAEKVEPHGDECVWMYRVSYRMATTPSCTGRRTSRRSGMSCKFSAASFRGWPGHRGTSSRGGERWIPVASCERSISLHKFFNKVEATNGSYGRGRSCSSYGSSYYTAAPSTNMMSHRNERAECGNKVT